MPKSVLLTECIRTHYPVMTITHLCPNNVLPNASSHLPLLTVQHRKSFLVLDRDLAVGRFPILPVIALDFVIRLYNSGHESTRSAPHTCDVTTPHT